MLNTGAPNSPARWLSENIHLLPLTDKYALMEMQNGGPRVVVTGTKGHCQLSLTNSAKQVICELSKYRKAVDS